MKTFSDEALNLSLMSPVNNYAEIQFKLQNKRALSIGEPCTCEYVTLLRSFHSGTLNIY